ncbi:MAG: hypothetical protein PHF60_01805 [Candidatus ainarchaeum sp.]|nr:hypothetical protein [Candidatus ainarchaeum sp.]
MRTTHREMQSRRSKPQKVDWSSKPLPPETSFTYDPRGEAAYAKLMQGKAKSQQSELRLVDELEHGNRERSWAVTCTARKMQKAAILSLAVGVVTFMASGVAKVLGVDASMVRAIQYVGDAMAWLGPVLMVASLVVEHVFEKRLGIRQAERTHDLLMNRKNVLSGVAITEAVHIFAGCGRPTTQLAVEVLESGVLHQRGVNRDGLERDVEEIRKLSRVG